ncbi:MAG TPA: hypothetical protein VE528_00540 [Thermoleophilaceae bacterium]|nr:hypothetical protein [Thermoleophilaceae bacterium]
MANRETERDRPDGPGYAGSGHAGPGGDHAHAKDKFGGFNWGAAFFGWLVATGVAVLLLALAGAIGGPIAGSSVGSTQQAVGAAGTIGIVGAIVFLIVLAIAYYAGGYVAGRMSRFDGGRQGLGVWIIGLVITILLAIAGAILGSSFNLLAQLNLPTVPNATSFGIGALITLVVVLVVTLLAAMGGGKLGQRYHRKVDTAAGV